MMGLKIAIGFLADTKTNSRTNVQAETSILWPPDAKSWLIGKDPDAGKHWRQEEKGMTEDEMIRYHHQLNGHEFEQTPGDSGEQRSLASVVHGVTKSQTWLSTQQQYKSE